MPAEGHPILSKIAVINSLNKANLENFQGSSPPSVFVGSYGYPKLSVAPLVTNFLGDVKEYDIPEKWNAMRYKEIIELRAGLLRADIGKFEVKNVNAVAEDFTLAKKSVDTEIHAKKKLMNLSFSRYYQPMGPSLKVEKIDITSNPTSNKRIEKVVNDEMKASDGIFRLYKKDVPVSRISRVLSVGMLGIKRKLVPTRWSITTTDDIVSKQIAERVRDYKEINNYFVFESSRLGNKYVILFFPEAFCFEQMEAWYKGSPWEADSVVTSDYELFHGRKKYVENIAGAYYAGKLACLEYLDKIKRKAGVIVFREITSDYSVPLGVWQVREGIRQALAQEPMKFETLNSALVHAKTKLTIPWEKWKLNSKILNFILNQKKIHQFF